MILGGLTFHLVPCAAVSRTSESGDSKHKYHRVPRNDHSEDQCVPQTLAESETENKHWCKEILAAFDFAILTNLKFIFLTLAGSTLDFCFVGWAVYVVPHGLQQGLSPVQSSILPTSFGVGNIVGKVALSLLLPRKVVDDGWIVILGSLLASALFVLDPFVNSFAGLLLVTGGLGLGNALCSVPVTVMYRNEIPDDRLLSAYSWHSFFVGAVMVLAGFASGKSPVDIVLEGVVFYLLGL